MIKRHNKKLLAFLVLVVLIVAFITIFLFISPEEIVLKIGVQNGYLLAFIVSLVGGFSAGGSITFISLLITLSIGGLDPIYLGLLAGTGLALGDTIIFYAGTRGRKLVRGTWDKQIHKVADVFKERVWLKKAIPILAYIYIGFTPLPNDVLLLFLAAIEYPAKKMNVIIIFGDITFALLVTTLAAKGFGL